MAPLTGIAFGVTGCSFGLSLLALAVFQYPLGIQALIGVIGSVGCLDQRGHHYPQRPETG